MSMLQRADGEGTCYRGDAMSDPLSMQDTLASHGSLGIQARLDVPSLEIDVARERARQGLFGEQHEEHKVSRFTLLHRVGSGGMGTVYAAYDPQLDRRIAVKVLTDAMDSGANGGRMLAEARAMAKVSHPNVVTVFEVGEHARAEDGSLSIFVAMEFVAGQTLRAWVEESRPAWPRIVAAYIAAGRGLAAVHRAGLVHRDFKPDNAMIGEGDRVQVMDFGLARDAAPYDSMAATVPDPRSAQSDGPLEGTLTRTGAIVGTPAYMAPEQLEGRGADARSDQWAFCVALYEAIWRERPFPAESPAELAAKVLSAEAPPDPPRTIVPRRIRLAIRRGLSPRPEDRWPSMDALLRELQPSRGRVTAWLGVGLGTLLLAYAAFGSAQREPPCRQSDEAFGDAWDEADATRVREAFGDLGVAFAPEAAEATTQAMAAYRTDWIDEHRATCEATRVHGTQSEAMLDKRMQCLARRRSEVAALADALAAPTLETLEHAASAVASVAPATRCGDTAFLETTIEPPSDPTQQAEVDVVRDRVAEADALWATGRRLEALALVREIVAGADAIDYAPALAEIHVAAGRMEAQAGELPRGIELLERGYSGARASKSARLAAEAAVELVTLCAGEGGELAIARTWLRVADAEVAAHELADFRWQLFDIEGALLEREGHEPEAIAARQRALETIDLECPGTGCAARAHIYGAIARLHSTAGRHDRALEYVKLAVETAQTGFGPDHPVVGTSLSQQGAVLAVLRRWDEAAVVLERALAIRRGSLSPGHPNLVTTMTTLGTAYAFGDRVEEGLELLRSAVAEARRAEDPFLVASTLNELGNACSRRERHQEAEAAWTEGLAAMRQAHPDGHPAIGIMLANVGMAASARGDHATALARLQEALALRLAAAPDEASNAPLYFNLANQLIALDRRDEGIAALRRTIELTEEGSLTAPGLRARVRLVGMIGATDRDEAKRIVASTKARCAALDEAGRAAAQCDRLDALDP